MPGREDELNMLRTLLASDNIERHDKDVFGDMYDRMFRGQRMLSHKQRAWVEKVYYKLGEKPKPITNRAAVAPKLNAAERKLMVSLRARKRVKGGV